MNFSLDSLNKYAIGSDGVIVPHNQFQFTKTLLVFGEKQVRLNYLGELFLINGSERIRLAQRSEVMMIVGMQYLDLSVCVALTHRCNLIFFNINHIENRICVAQDAIDYTSLRVNENELTYLGADTMHSIYINPRNKMPHYMFVSRPIFIGRRTPCTLCVFNCVGSAYFNGHDIRITYSDVQLKRSDGGDPVPIHCISLRYRYLLVLYGDQSLMLWDAPQQTVLKIWKNVNDFAIDPTQNWIAINKESKQLLQ